MDKRCDFFPSVWIDKDGNAECTFSITGRGDVRLLAAPPSKRIDVLQLCQPERDEPVYENLISFPINSLSPRSSPGIELKFSIKKEIRRL
jgi:hypothetical protein